MQRSLQVLISLMRRQLPALFELPERNLLFCEKYHTITAVNHAIFNSTGNVFIGMTDE